MIRKINMECRVVVDHNLEPDEIRCHPSVFNLLEQEYVAPINEKFKYDRIMQTAKNLTKLLAEIRKQWPHNHDIVAVLPGDLVDELIILL